ncbi:MAG: hypothetical protein JWQ63_3345 [Mucilaginibacter sp.]|jgi:hypothetical protein|nr:hypothetical protein [Mucilaginibacter sp.]
MRCHPERSEGSSPSKGERHTCQSVEDSSLRSE